MKACVNKDVCIGCGACQSIAPDIFEFGDDGFANATGIITDENKEDAIDAKESCPTGAIEITE